ncbi:hypothetical protein GBW32_16150 [Streptomyces tsukubensis]|nr:hypothetical protein GBW32_16150 [Streptomyces tsukubensis]
MESPAGAGREGARRADARPPGVAGASGGRAVAAVTPALGAAVMATGIVSVGCHTIHADEVSLALLVIACLLWVFLVAVFARRFVVERDRWLAEVRTAASLTGVAGTAVLGVRISLLDLRPLAGALLAVATLAWLVFLPEVLRHLARRVPGVAYLACVSTQSLAVLGATLATVLPTMWPLWPALGLFVLGLALYVLVLTHFDFGQLRTGAGDHWVACGAVSISALAAAKLTTAAAPGSPVDWARPLHPWLRGATLVLLVIALLWYVVIAYWELRNPRPAYDIRRWATVFPLGMTAVAALTTAAATGIAWPERLGRFLLWVSVAVWLLVAVGAGHRVVRGWR